MRISPIILALSLFGSAFVGWFANSNPAESKKSRDPAPTFTHQKSSQPSLTSTIPSELARQIDSVSFNLSLQEVVEKHHPGRLTELALWLSDATSDQMNEAWRALHAADKLDSKSYDLFMKHWTQVDPRGAIAVARETSHESIAWWAWGRNEPERAFAACQTESPDHLAATLRGIGQQHPELAQRLLEENPHLSSHYAVEGISQGMDDKDPLTAFETAAQHGFVVREPLKNLARADPLAALQWMDSRRLKGYEQKEALNVLVTEHPEEVTQYLANLPTGALRSALLEAQLNQLASQDPSQALDLVAAQPSSDLRAKLFKQLIKQTPEPSARLGILGQALENLCQVPQESRSAFQLHTEIQRLLTSSPDETIALLQQYDQENLDSHAISSWVKNDTTSAATWLGQQPASEKRDQYTSSLIDSLLSQRHDPFTDRSLPILSNADFEGSLAWAEFIGKEEMRLQKSREVIANWLEHRPEEAAAYFETASSASTSREIFQNLKQEVAE